MVSYEVQFINVNDLVRGAINVNDLVRGNDFACLFVCVDFHAISLRHSHVIV